MIRALLLLAILVAAPASADEYYFRQYLGLVPKILDNLETRRSPYFQAIGLQIVLKTPSTDMPALDPVLERADALGIPVIPGWRVVMTSTAIDAAKVWTRNAELLREFIALYPRFQGTRMAFDLEEYTQGGESLAATLDAQSAAMAPFLAVLAEARIIPAIYPADPDDLVTLAIGDASAGRIELWTERDFGLSERMRSNPAAADAVLASMARIQTRFRSRWPDSIVRHGSYDHLLRAWGAPARARLLDFGSHLPWIFQRDRIDEWAIGTSGWYAGTSRSTTNDPAHAWVAPPMSVGGVNGSPAMMVVQATSAGRADLRSSDGQLLSDGRVLRAGDVLQRSGSDTIVVDVVIPRVGDGPVFGASQRNSETWQVSARGDAIMLEHRGREPVKLGLAVRGEPTRIVLTNKAPNAGHLWIGLGTRLDGTGSVVMFDGLVFRGAEVWHRWLSDVEQAAVRARAYPR